MTEQTSTLYAKLLGETAVISWAELQPFFARGALLQVDAALDLVEVAEGRERAGRRKKRGGEAPRGVVQLVQGSVGVTERSWCEGRS